jgi:peroxiredoxin (alkyl hydroperoxide reductase subunit C)
MASVERDKMSTQDTPRPATNRTGPHLDFPAPDFTARTTQGLRRLSHYKGKWLILFSHPADFTPVCTSEFLAFERKAAAFKERNCELLGLSVDSVFSHKAWLDSIRSHFGVQISFPIIEDVSMSIAYDYGMIHRGSVSTATVRSVFFIDPNGILRALVHHPATVGRSVDEIYRVLVSLQHTDAMDGVVVPEGWVPGDKVLLDTAFGLEAANDDAEGLWYYQERDFEAPETAS